MEVRSSHREYEFYLGSELTIRNGNVESVVFIIEIDESVLTFSDDEFDSNGTSVFRTTFTKI